MNKLTIALVFLVFAVPITLSYVLYLSGWRPEGTANHGELVQPPRAIQDVRLETLEGAPIRFADLRRKWALVYFGSAECLAPCERNLYKMRQIQLAQGKHADRVQRLFILTDTRAVHRLRALLEGYPGMRVIAGPTENVGALARQFALPVGTPLDGLDRVYVVDPAGNWMMTYPVDADPSGMRKDLKRLLKVSQIG
ncbi:MAG: SCO family protein [Acidiferrobacterales bacterium]